MRYRLDGWHADYAFPYQEPDPDEGPAPDVDVGVEAPGHDWAPVTPDRVDAFAEVRFVDGVQSSDAVIWIDDVDGGEPVPGLVASWAAGVMLCRPGGAVLEQPTVERGVFSDARDIGSIVAANLTWRAMGRREGDSEDLLNRLRSARRSLEQQVGGRAPDDTLLVFDGLLHPGPARTAAVGMAKRAHRTYLAPAQQSVLRELRTGQRTPVFAVTAADRSRYSFYLCLADPLPRRVAAAGSGVCRLEFVLPQPAARDDLTVFADRVAATLPAYASEPHKDPRAPQNLYPIKGLEQELRRYLGRPAIIRTLLAAQAG